MTETFTNFSELRMPTEEIVTVTAEGQTYLLS